MKWPIRIYPSSEPSSFYISFLLLATLLVTPVSPTLRSVLFIISAASIMVTSGFREHLFWLLSQRWCQAILIFFMIAAVACFWSPASYAVRFHFLEKYSKLLYLPIFTLGFSQAKIRTYGIYVFIFTMLVICLFSLFIQKDAVFGNHIVTSYMMSMAAYLSGFIFFRSQYLKRWLFLFLILLFSYQLIFINQGRAGYVMYVVLMLMLLIQHLPKKWMLIGIFSFCSIFTLLSLQSNIFSHRIADVRHELHDYQFGKQETSVGFRLVFHSYAKSIFLSHPWIGRGIGGFAHDFQQDTTYSAWKKLQDPHSGYWLVASDFGLLGLFALAYLFITFWRAGYRLQETKFIMQALLVSFAIGNITDSFLFYSSTSCFFIMFSALCLGELHGKYPRNGGIIKSGTKCTKT